MEYVYPRVVYVDEDYTASETMLRLMISKSIPVQLASNGPQALEIAESLPIGIFLLDSLIPPTDGVEVCRQLRQRFPQTPVVFYTGTGHQTERERAFEAGATDFVVKPDFDGLFDVLHRLVAQPEPGFLRSLDPPRTFGWTSQSMLEPDAVE